MLQVEHIAWQVEDPVAVARWYVEHLDFQILRKLEASPFTHFIADSARRVVLEIYNNPAVTTPDYPEMNPLLLHLAFMTADPQIERDRLVLAGATIAEDLFVTPAGDQIIMLRDPFGFAIQLCNRASPML